MSVFLVEFVCIMADFHALNACNAAMAVAPHCTGCEKASVMYRTDLIKLLQNFFLYSEDM